MSTGLLLLFQVCQTECFLTIAFSSLSDGMYIEPCRDACGRTALEILAGILAEIFAGGRPTTGIRTQRHGTAHTVAPANTECGVYPTPTRTR